MDAISIQNLLITANVNTVQNSIAFNKEHNLFALSVANSVMICDPNGSGINVPKVLFSLRGHLERVNGVQWLTSNSLVSISSDKSFIVWSFNGNPRNPKDWTYKRCYSDAHDQAINYLCTFSVKDQEYYILTMCTGGTLKLWQGKD